MKIVILAGGLGTRLSEETGLRPKPMVEIGGRPILWHIMKIFSAQGYNEFVICCGYKAHVIKEYFANFHLQGGDITFDISRHEMKVHRNGAEPWVVTLADTGENTMTGGRLKRVQEYVGNEPFFMTYGDGVANIDVKKLLEFHKNQNTKATVTAVQPPGRFGVFHTEGDDTKVQKFTEKPAGDGTWINGGFFVLEPSVFEYIKGDETVWEEGPMRELASQGQLAAYKHAGFWHCMDSLRDKKNLEELWASGKPPWKVWS